MDMEFSFPNGNQVNALLKGFTVTAGSNGEEDRPSLEPLDFFFASLGLCVGKYVAKFCSARDIPYKDAKIFLQTEWDETTRLHTKVMLRIQLPAGFPEKYRKPVLRVVDSCSVKKHILNPPSFEASAVIGEGA